jgi:hypothetical protein
VAKLLKPEEVHPLTFRGANKHFVPQPTRKIAIRTINRVIHSHTQTHTHTHTFSLFSSLIFSSLLFSCSHSIAVVYSNSSFSYWNRSIWKYFRKKLKKSITKTYNDSSKRNKKNERNSKHLGLIMTSLALYVFLCLSVSLSFFFFVITAMKFFRCEP